MIINLTTGQILKGFLKKNSTLFMNTTGDGTVKLTRDTGEFEILNFKSINSSNREFSRYHSDVDIEVYVESGTASIESSGFVKETLATIDQTGTSVTVEGAGGGQAYDQTLNIGDDVKFASISTDVVASNAGLDIDINSFSSLALKSVASVANGVDCSNAITVDNLGNTYVASSSYVNATGIRETRITKYDSQGAFIWSRNFSQADESVSIETIKYASDGFLYAIANVLGELTTKKYPVLLKLTTSGSVVWQQKFENTVATAADDIMFATCLAEATGTGIYIACTAYIQSNKSRSYIVKVDRDGNIVWVKKASSDTRDVEIEVVRLRGQNLYVLLNAYNAAVVDSDGSIIQKLTLDGDEVWKKEFLSWKLADGPGGFYVSFARCFDVDDLGNIYVGSNGEYKTTNITKFDNSGAIVWSKDYTNSVDNAYNPATMRVDVDGNIVILGTGTHWAELSAEGLAITKFDPNGNIVAARFFGIDPTVSTGGMGLNYYWTEHSALSGDKKYYYVSCYSGISIGSLMLRIDKDLTTINADIGKIFKIHPGPVINIATAVPYTYERTDFVISPDTTELVYGPEATLNNAAFTFDTSSVFVLASGGGLFEFDAQGRLTTKGVVLTGAAPATSKGATGDKAGMVAIDGSYLYHCIGAYDGTTDIWMRVALTGGVW